MNRDYARHCIIPQQVNHQAPFDFPVKSIMAQVADLSDQAICSAIISAAKEAGVTDLYLMDKTFMLDALQEKAERENPKPLTIEELYQMQGEPVYVKGLGWRVNYEMQVFMGKFYLYTGMSSRIEVNDKVKLYRHKPKEVE